MPKKNKKDSYWLEIFDQYRNSGKSQSKFCLENSHPYSQFKYYWGKLVQKPQRSQSAVASDFIPVSIQTQPLHQSVTSYDVRSTTAVIELPNKIRCTLTIAPGDNQLSTLLKQLVAIC